VQPAPRRNSGQKNRSKSTGLGDPHHSPQTGGGEAHGDYSLYIINMPEQGTLCFEVIPKKNHPLSLF
jgi:hypothetical protein